MAVLYLVLGVAFPRMGVFAPLVENGVLRSSGPPGATNAPARWALGMGWGEDALTGVSVTGPDRTASKVWTVLTAVEVRGGRTRSGRGAVQRCEP